MGGGGGSRIKIVVFSSDVSRLNQSQACILIMCITCTYYTYDAQSSLHSPLSATLP